MTYSNLIFTRNSTNHLTTEEIQTQPTSLSNIFDSFSKCFIRPNESSDTGGIHCALPVRQKSQAYGQEILIVKIMVTDIHGIIIIMS